MIADKPEQSPNKARPNKARDIYRNGVTTVDLWELFFGGTSETHSDGSSTERFSDGTSVTRESDGNKRESTSHETTLPQGWARR